MINIVINETSIEMSNRNSITGEMYFQVGDYVFPELNWNDFIVVILSWWNKSIHLLEASAIGSSQDFDFMDGPFYVHAVKKDSLHLSLSFTQTKRAGTEVIASMDTDIAHMKTLIADVSRKVLKELYARDWLTKDVIELKKEIK